MAGVDALGLHMKITPEDSQTLNSSTSSDERIKYEPHKHTLGVCGPNTLIGRTEPASERRNLFSLVCSFDRMGESGYG